MSDFIGSVISLISKSDIRYVGTLVEINSAESTVSLENVKSHGTEGRKKDPADEVQGSPQIYEFIVFRGSDVKDLVVDEAPAPKEPPQMPNDPAILGARSHPGRAPSGPYNQGPQGPQGPQGAPGFQNQNMYAAYPPQGPPQGWAGRGGPPGPPGPPGAYGMPYPPQGWYPPPGQPGFQNAPPPWAYNPGFAGGQGPPAPPGMQQQPPQQQQQGPGLMNNSVGPQSQNKSAPTGPGAGQNKAVAPVEMSSDSQVLAQQPVNQAAPVAPTPPIASKPSAQEVKQTAQLLENQKPSGPSNAPKQIPTGPRGPTNMASSAAPAPVAVPAAHQTSAEDARQAVVQAAIARLGQTGMGGAVPQAPANGVDNLTRKVNEMSMNANRAGLPNLRGHGFNRGRGRGAGGLQGAPNVPQAKIEIPKSDFDFAEANAKFNRDDVIKEKIAGTAAADVPDSTDPQATGETTPAYDKKTSFFDNIGTDRQRKELQFDRTAERGKDIDTFGQASVDGGFRRGRGGRGRGYRGRGRGRGYGGRAYPPRNVAQPGP